METREEKRFRKYLEVEGMRLTPERRLVLLEVFRNHDHFEAEDIVMGLRRQGKRVSRASVYRTLPLLTESGLLREVHSGEKHSHFEHIFGHEHHDHLICTRCCRMIEFGEDEIEALQTKVCSEMGFRPTSHKLEIMGTCAECIRETE